MAITTFHTYMLMPPSVRDVGAASVIPAIENSAVTTLGLTELSYLMVEVLMDMGFRAPLRWPPDMAFAIQQELVARLIKAAPQVVNPTVGTRPKAKTIRRKNVVVGPQNQATQAVLEEANVVDDEESGSSALEDDARSIVTVVAVAESDTVMDTDLLTLRMAV